MPSSALNEIVEKAATSTDAERRELIRILREIKEGESNADEKEI